jgi:hypothetical protein
MIWQVDLASVTNGSVEHVSFGRYLVEFRVAMSMSVERWGLSMLLSANMYWSCTTEDLTSWTEAYRYLLTMHY